MESKIIHIKYIYLNEYNQLNVKPKPKQHHGDYCWIFESAMGVYWDNWHYHLISDKIDNERGIVEWFKQICLAVKNKYGETLNIDKDTIFDDKIDERTRELLREIIF